MSMEMFLFSSNLKLYILSVFRVRICLFRMVSRRLIYFGKKTLNAVTCKKIRNNFLRLHPFWNIYANENVRLIARLTFPYVFMEGRITKQNDEPAMEDNVPIFIKCTFKTRLH